MTRIAALWNASVVNAVTSSEWNVHNISAGRSCYRQSVFIDYVVSLIPLYRSSVRCSFSGFRLVGHLL